MMTFDTKLHFGKYKGKTIREVYEIDSSYLVWAIRKTSMLNLSEKDIKKIEDKYSSDLFDRAMSRVVKKMRYFPDIDDNPYPLEYSGEWGSDFM